MDPVEDRDLLYIAEWALTAAVPEGWVVHMDGKGREFFYNPHTGQSMYEHPMDDHYHRVGGGGDKGEGGWPWGGRGPVPVPVPPHQSLHSCACAPLPPRAWRACPCFISC